MITHEELTTSITFGKDGIATIGVLARNEGMENYGKLTFQQLVSNDLTIGAEIKPSDLRELPKVELHFHSLESVDVLIKGLQRVKESMQYPYGTFPLAC